MAPTFCNSCGSACSNLESSFRDRPIETVPMKRRTRNQGAAVEREFANALDWEVAKAGSVTYRTVTARLRGLERSFLNRAGRKFVAREMERRIAEQMLEQAIFHNCPLAICRGKLKALEQLGFTNIERKGHCYLLYARGALARGHERVAQITAKAMARDLERSLYRRRSLLARDLLKSIRDVLRSSDESPPMKTAR
jgi:hypothetical protein